MKEVRAYVHRSRVADVLAALKDSPAWGGEHGGRRHNVTAYIVRGSLMPLRVSERHFSMELGEEVIDEYKLEILCEDAEVDAIVDTLQRAARTGQAIAGWITIADIERALPIT